MPVKERLFTWQGKCAFGIRNSARTATPSTPNVAVIPVKKVSPACYLRHLAFANEALYETLGNDPQHPFLSELMAEIDWLWKKIVGINSSGDSPTATCRPSVEESSIDRLAAHVLQAGGPLKDKHARQWRDDYVLRFRRLGQLIITERKTKEGVSLFQGCTGFKVLVDERGKQTDSPGLSPGWPNGPCAMVRSSFAVGDAYGHQEATRNEC